MAKLDALTALRVGVAAQCLPGVSLKALVEALICAVGYPLSCERLAVLTAGCLVRASPATFAALRRRDLFRAVDYLRGTTQIGISGLDVPLPHASGMVASVRIAIASSYAETADCAFGEAPRFLVYQIGGQQACLLEIRDVNTTGATDRIEQISDCDVVYSTGIGARNVAGLVRAGIHPITCKPGSRVSNLINILQNVLRDVPPPWLAKRMGRHVGAQHPDCSTASAMDTLPVQHPDQVRYSRVSSPA